MSITINSIRENDDDQTIFFTLKEDGENYEFSADIPIMPDGEVLDYLEANSEKYLVLILDKTYRGADWKRFKTNENSDLQAMKTWIQKGHKNKIKDGDKWKYKVIEKTPFKSNHPSWVKIDKDIEAIKNISQVKVALRKIVRRIS